MRGVSLSAPITIKNYRVNNEKILQDAVLKLLGLLPEFRGVFDENIELDGEILAYPIFGDLTRFFVKNIRENNIAITDRIQEYVEEMLASKNVRIQELAAFGFLENLESAVATEDEYKYLKTMLKPQLLKELKRIDAWWYGE